MGMGQSIQSLSVAREALPNPRCRGAGGAEGRDSRRGGVIPRRYRGANTMSKPVVLITGALSGIGRATAVAFAQQGARVVVAGRREEAGQALAAELRGMG